MPEKPTTDPVVYESTNRELRTVSQYFQEEDRAVQDVRWEEDIEVGSHIEPGRLLAHVIFDAPPPEPLHAPEACAGEIEWINRRIPYEWLDVIPVTLLLLKARQTNETT
jgi:hypothetical protein